VLSVEVMRRGASPMMGGNSRIIWLEVGRIGLNCSASSDMGLRVLPGASWGARPGREVQKTGWLLNPSQALGGR
jgi:hypothetical protein